MQNKVTHDADAEALSQPRSHRPFRTVSFAMGQALVDLDKATALAAELEDQELIARLNPRPEADPPARI